MKRFYFFMFFFINATEESEFVVNDENLMLFQCQENISFFDIIGEKTYDFACKFLCCFY